MSTRNDDNVLWIGYVNVFLFIVLLIVVIFVATPECLRSLGYIETHWWHEWLK